MTTLIIIKEKARDFKSFIKTIKIIKFLNLSLTKKSYVFGAEVRPRRSLQAAYKQFSLKKGERFSKTRYVHCLCFSKNHMLVKLRKNQYNLNIMNHFMQCFVT